MTVSIDREAFRPLVELIVAEVLDKLQGQLAQGDENIAYTEEKAAQLLGVSGHVLRDARLRGEIKASKLGKRIIYSRRALEAFADRNEP